MTPDLINAAFEALAGLFILNHCRVLIRDKMVRGVSVISAGFFTAWGFWNLYFYPAVGQFWSFVGGIFVVLANAIYVAMLVYYIWIYDPFTGDELEMNLHIDMLGGRRK